MPSSLLVSQEETRLLRVDAAYIVESGLQKEWDAISNHPLGKQVGTRIVTILGDEWIDLKTEIGWFERENLSGKAMNVRIRGDVARRIAANGGQMGDNDDIDIPVEQADEATIKRLRHMKTYMHSWSIGKIDEAQLKAMRPEIAWGVQEIIAQITKGQVFLKDSPLPSSLKSSSEA